MRRSDVRGQMWETLVPWILGLLVLVLFLFYYFVLKEKGDGALEYLKNLIKFR